MITTGYCTRENIFGEFSESTSSIAFILSFSTHLVLWNENMDLRKQHIVMLDN